MSSSVNKAHLHTQPLAEPYGWQGPKPAHHGPLPLPMAPPASRQLDPGRVRDFMQGVHRRVRTALATADAYVGVRAWSAWRRHLGDSS